MLANFPRDLPGVFSVTQSPSHHKSRVSETGQAGPMSAEGPFKARRSIRQDPQQQQQAFQSSILISTEYAVLLQYSTAVGWPVSVPHAFETAVLNENSKTIAFHLSSSDFRLSTWWHLPCGLCIQLRAVRCIPVLEARGSPLYV